MLIPQSLGRPVSREVGWEGALDTGRPSDYSQSRNDSEVIMSRSPSAAVADDWHCRCLLPLSLSLPLSAVRWY